MKKDPSGLRALRGSATHAADNRRQGLRPGQRRQRRHQGHLHRQRQRREERRGRTHDRRQRHDGLSGRGGRPHSRRRRRAQLRARARAGKPARGPQVPARGKSPRRHRRHDAHHVRHRLSLRRDGLDDGQRSGRARAVREAHARRAARHADRGQVVPAADGQQRDGARPARGRRCRTGPSRRGLADLGRQGVRRQGGESWRRGGVEVGQERERSCTSRSRATRP